MTSMLRDDIISTMIWRHFDVVCMLGLNKTIMRLKLEEERACCENVSLKDEYNVYHI